MAASGYMTYDDFKSIWTSDLIEARFDLINVRLGEILNYFFTRDAPTDITDVTILPILEQLSEEALMNLLNGAKANKFSDVWQFINANAARIMSQILRDNREIVEMINLQLSNVYHYTETDRYSYNVGEGGLIKRTT